MICVEEQVAYWAGLVLKSRSGYRASFIKRAWQVLLLTELYRNLYNRLKNSKGAK